MKKQTRLLITIVILIVVSLSIGQVTVSNSLSTTGITLAKIEKEIGQYTQENALLREKVLTLSSLTNIASIAATLGFVEEKSQIVVGHALPIAIKQ